MSVSRGVGPLLGENAARSRGPRVQGAGRACPEERRRSIGGVEQDRGEGVCSLGVRVRAKNDK